MSDAQTSNGELVRGTTELPGVYPAHLLYLTSDLMRLQHGPDHPRHAMWAAMGDLLENALHTTCEASALAMARAYLNAIPDTTTEDATSAPEHRERGYEAQLRTRALPTWMTLTDKPEPEDRARARYIEAAACDHSERESDEPDDCVEWRLVRVVEEVVEAPRTSRQVIEWLTSQEPLPSGDPR